MDADDFKQWRVSRGITQQELAYVLGAHPITISKIERGKIRFKGRLETRLLSVVQRGVEAADLLKKTPIKY